MKRKTSRCLQIHTSSAGFRLPAGLWRRITRFDRNTLNILWTNPLKALTPALRLPLQLLCGPSKAPTPPGSQVQFPVIEQGTETSWVTGSICDRVRHDASRVTSVNRKKFALNQCCSSFNNTFQHVLHKIQRRTLWNILES